MTSLRIDDLLADIQGFLDEDIIQTGKWTDDNYKHGAIITVGPRAGPFVNSLIAGFTAVVLLRLWVIIMFLAHQTMATEHNRDALHHQILLVFRLLASPLSAPFTLLQLLLAWKRRNNRAVRRCLGWIIFGILYYLIMAGLSASMSTILTAESPNRLLKPKNSGYNVLGSSYTPADLLSESLNAVNRSQQAAALVQKCYGGNGNALDCNLFVQPYLGSTVTLNTECPFPDLCLGGNSSALTITSVLDSRVHLGINTDDSDVVTLVRNATYAPLHLKPYTLVRNSTLAPRNETIEVYIGNTVADNNYTFSYETVVASTGQGWDLSFILSQNRYQAAWTPIPELNRTDGDVTVMLVEMNDVESLTPNLDPVFGSTVFDHNQTLPDGTVQNFYTSEYWLSFIGMVESYAVCQKNGTGCTPYDGAANLFSNALNTSSGVNFNAMQLNTIARLTIQAENMLFYNVMQGRGASALRLTESLSGLIQGPLPSNQWEIEMLNAANTGLAILAQGIVDYARQTEDQYNGSSTVLPGDRISEIMTRNVMTRATGGTISFSGLGVSIFLGIGVSIIALSFAFIPLTSQVQRRCFGGRYDYKRLAWILTSAWHIHMAYWESLGLITWSNPHDSVPLTEDNGEFGGWGPVDEEYKTHYQALTKLGLLSKPCIVCAERPVNSSQSSQSSPRRAGGPHDVGRNF
ncbi:hypothetical protein ANO11243_056600 [Dothideomycetidae sp. 11243]|nr:hypothetical protein ANO11243_056600 [fungal sp. No.11243]